MSFLRLRVQIDSGSKAVPLSRIAGFSEKLNSFLRSLGGDLGLPDDDNVWCASQFRDGSAVYTASASGEYAQQIQTNFYNATLACLNGNENMLDQLNVSLRTRVDYQQVAESAKTGNTKLGLYRSDKARRPRWFALDASVAAQLAETIQRRSTHLGSVRGFISSVYCESQPPYLWLREMSSGQRIKCEVRRDDFSKVAALLRKPKDAVAIWGEVTIDRVDHSTYVRAERFQRLPRPLSDEEFESFFGCSSGMTGKLSIIGYLEKFRDDAD